MSIRWMRTGQIKGSRVMEAVGWSKEVCGYLEKKYNVTINTWLDTVGALGTIRWTVDYPDLATFDKTMTAVLADPEYWRFVQNAMKNEYAHLKLADISLETVKASPMMWDPVRFLESCPSSDGACAVVLADEASAASCAVPAWVQACAVRSEPPVSPFHDNVDPRCGRDCAAAVYRDAGVSDPVRDLDVLTARLRVESAGLGEDGNGGKAILGALGRERTASRRRLVRALGSARYFALLDRLEAAADPPLADPSPDLSLAAIWRAEHSTLKKAVTRLGEPPGDDDLHAARIKVKRARYAAELARLEPYVRAAKALQDVLGEHQDSVGAEARLRIVAAGRPETAIAAGRLVEREHERRASAAEAWKKQWARLAREAKRV